jgi:hypothetical protein
MTSPSSVAAVGVVVVHDDVLGHYRQPAGLSWEAWDTLDPGIQEALLDGRLTLEELNELTGWLGEDEVA